MLGDFADQRRLRHILAFGAGLVARLFRLFLELGGDLALGALGECTGWLRSEEAVDRLILSAETLALLRLIRTVPAL